jgi:hypothetical protein
VVLYSFLPVVRVETGKGLLFTVFLRYPVGVVPDPVFQHPERVRVNAS